MKSLQFKMLMAIQVIAWATIGMAHGQTWLKQGNPGVLNTDFIGPVNSIALNFSVFGSKSGCISPGGWTCLGYRSGIGTIDHSNLALGAGTLSQNTTGTSNLAAGYKSMELSTTGFGNTAVGMEALSASVSGSNNIAVGNQALAISTAHSKSVAVGSQAMVNHQDGEGTVAVGSGAMATHYYDSYSSSWNAALGKNAAKSDSSSGSNTAIGSSAMDFNHTGISNVALGTIAFRGNGGGNNAVAIGYAALNGVCNGNGNVAVGNYAAPIDAIAASRNTALGMVCMQNTDLGNNNSNFGAGSNAAAVASQNATSIGHSAVASSSHMVRLGNVNVTVVEGQVPYSYPSDGRFKSNVEAKVPGLDFVNRLRPVSYVFDREKFAAHLGQEAKEQDRSGVDVPEMARRQSGFLAQEVEIAANAIGYDFDGVHIPAADTDHYSLAYDQFVVPLVQAVQELNAQKEALSERERAQNQEIDRIVGELQAVQAELQQLSLEAMD